MKKTALALMLLMLAVFCSVAASADAGYEAPKSMEVILPSRTLAAGESMQVTVELPEGSWAPADFTLWYNAPVQSGLTGPVAMISKDGVLTGLTAGTCTLQVSCAGLGQMIPITVTDSELSLCFDIPEPAFDWRTPFRLAVHDRAGHHIPAVFSVSGAANLMRVDDEGVLTADGKGYYGTVTAVLENGATYTFRVQSTELPAWLEPETDLIELPLNYTRDMCGITADISFTPQSELILCSDNESVLRINSWRLLPQSPGVAVVTAWSKYCDTCCRVTVHVMEADSRLYINGTPFDAGMEVPEDIVTDLPVVTDYFGNPVNVTWSVTFQRVTSANPYGRFITLINGNQVLCEWEDGMADLEAVSDAGDKIRLQVTAYKRGDRAHFGKAEYTVSTGNTVQVNFHHAAGPYLSGESQSPTQTDLNPRDVTFTITGDTDCVSVDPHFDYHTFTGLREGTVTLTATLYNGFTASTVIHVITPDKCKDGHDPQWDILREPTATVNGIKALRCSRCHVPLGEEKAIPCTGTLGFAQDEIWLVAGTYGETAALGAELNGDRKQSFTYRTSDPEVAVCLGGTVIGLAPGTATVTLTKGDCEPAVCTVHVLPVTELSLPTALTVIEEGAFEGVAATCVTIPSGVTEIGDYAFANCRFLTEITIPGSVASIGGHAFSGSPRVVVICPQGSFAAAWADAHGIPWAEE